MLRGGYQIIDLKHKKLVAASNISLPGIYNRIESTTKPLLLSNINVNGVEKHDSFITPTISGTNYVITIYGLKLTIASSDIVTVANA